MSTRYTHKYRYAASNRDHLADLPLAIQTFSYPQFTDNAGVIRKFRVIDWVIDGLSGFEFAAYASIRKRIDVPDGKILAKYHTKRGMMLGLFRLKNVELTQSEAMQQIINKSVRVLLPPSQEHAMHNSGFKKDDFVLFGRPGGEQTLGQIVRLNPKTATVKQLEQRGVQKTHHVGKEWKVSYSLMRLARPDGKLAEPSQQPAVPQHQQEHLLTRDNLKYSPFAREDNMILAAIVTVYSHLSPENLTADGERPRDQVRSLQAKYNRKLKHLQHALGYAVSEDAAFRWDQSRRDYEQNRVSEFVSVTA